MTKAMTKKAAEKSRNSWTIRLMMTFAVLMMALTFSFTAMAGSRTAQSGGYRKTVSVNGDSVYTVRTEKGTAKVVGHFDDVMTENIRVQLNSYRTRKGRTALKKSQDLMAASKIRAYESAYSFDHTRPDGTACFTASSEIYGENLAYGYYSAKSVMNGWKASSGHNRNMLGRYYRTVGIAVFWAKEKSGSYTPYSVQLFGY